MISFEKSKAVSQSQYLTKTVADNMMRPVSRHFDENEGEIPWDYIEFMHGALKSMGSASLVPDQEKKKKDEKEKRPSQAYVVMAHQIEMLSWGDAGFYLCTPRGGLGSAAVEAAGTPEQKEKFLSILNGDKPVFTAMAITEADAGSDNSAIRATAVLDEDTNEWVLNGEKIFVTAGHKAMVDTEGYTVVWASLDLEAGRAGIRSFVVPAGTPGAKITNKEIKLGIRSSDTVTLVLENARVPNDHILGSPEIEKSTKGFKGAMQTFNVTRPLVASSALGVARAALEETKRLLKEQGVELRMGLPRVKMTSIESDIVDMERMLRSCWLLTIKAVWMSDARQANAKESAMSKLYAGDVVTKITQKAVEILGPLGYSREYLIEKWMRDAKINDIYEGTGQINRLIAARALLGYRGKDLR
ncbi:MAG TPA: acyl-CoA dehydrogenase family protein [Anaerolineales bacterium]|nr:acyl-CoA dehydrogenase family protein [Anaerolineales bacterium]